MSVKNPYDLGKIKQSRVNVKVSTDTTGAGGKLPFFKALKYMIFGENKPMKTIKQKTDLNYFDELFIGFDVVTSPDETLTQAAAQVEKARIALSLEYDKGRQQTQTNIRYFSDLLLDETRFNKKLANMLQGAHGAEFVYNVRSQVVDHCGVLRGDLVVRWGALTKLIIQDLAKLELRLSYAQHMRGIKAAFPEKDEYDAYLRESTLHVRNAVIVNLLNYPDLDVAAERIEELQQAALEEQQRDLGYSLPQGNLNDWK